MTPGSPLGRGLGSLIPNRSAQNPTPTPTPPPAPVRPIRPAEERFVPPPRPEYSRPREEVVERPLVVVPPKYSDEPLPVRAVAKATVAANQIMDIPLGLIDPNPHQPRHHVHDETLEDLMESIRQHGILQPVIATKHGQRYELIAGERRFRSAERLGLATIPAIVRDVHEIERLELAIVENIQRQNLNPIEEAQGYQQLVDEFGLTQDDVAKKVGKRRATVANALRILTLPIEIQQALRDGRLTMSHAKVLLGAVTPVERDALFRQITEQGMPVRAAAEAGRAGSLHRHARRNADPYTQAVEDELRDTFGTRVVISKRNNRGNIKIEFYSDEEFEQIIQQLRRH